MPDRSPRSLRERSLGSPSRRNEGQRRKSERRETRRLIASDWGAEGQVRVAMLASISWRVPPRHYGPWELFASLLTEGLVERGHDVTLFATGDSKPPPVFAVWSLEAGRRTRASTRRSPSASIFRRCSSGPRNST